MRTPITFLVLLTLGSQARATERALSLVDALNLAHASSSRLRQANIDAQRAALTLLQQRLARVDFKLTGFGSSVYQGITDLPPQQCVGQAIGCRGSIYQGNLTATLKIPVWTGLTLESTQAQASFKEKSARATLRDAQRKLDLDVIQAYWEVRRRELELEVAQQMLRHDREFEHLTQQKVTAGIAPSVDVNRAREASLALEQRIITNQSQLDQARAQLASILEIEDDIKLTDDPTRHTPVLPTLDDAIAEALRNRPDLAVVQHDYDAARMGHRAALGAFWPQLSAVATGELAYGNVPITPATNANTPADTSTAASTLAGMTSSPFQPAAGGAGSTASFYVGGQLNWTIFDMANNVIKARDAGHEEDRADADRRRRRHDVIADVRTAHAQLTEAIAAQEPANTTVTLARTTLELLRRRYSVGSSQLIDVLDAQDKLLNDEVTLIDRQVDLIEADQRLMGALGRF